MEKTIMDVSRHQGVIDWAKVKASGKVDGVMIRAMGNSGAGKASKPYLDPYFARNYAECTRVGLPVGVYGYFKATTKAQADKELALFKQALGGRTFQLPVAVDIEDEVQKPLGKAALTNLTAHMLSTVESWGVYALLYTGLWFGSTFLYMGGAALKPYDVWLAAYRTRKPAPGWPFGMWQYTSTARVPGVSTNVDMSHAYKDYAAIIKRAGLGAVKGGVTDGKHSRGADHWRAEPAGGHLLQQPHRPEHGCKAGQAAGRDRNEAGGADPGSPGAQQLRPARAGDGRADQSGKSSDC